jgi:hypothetical protein
MLTKRDTVKGTSFLFSKRGHEGPKESSIFSYNVDFNFIILTKDLLLVEFLFMFN